MRMIFATLAAAALLSTAALADPMAATYGNTVTMTNAAGETTKLMIDADGTYTSMLPNGEMHKGTWAVDGDQACFTQTEPAPAEGQAPACGDVSTERAVGDTWEVTAEDGAVTTMAIVEGR